MSATEARSQRFLWIALMIGAAAGVAVCYGIATQTIVLGSREGRWVYGYLQPFRLTTFAVFLVALLVSAGLLCAGARNVPRHDWQQIVLWTVVALGLQALIRSLTPFSFERIFVSDGANSFYSVTRDYRASAVLTDFDRMHRQFPLHAQSNMPGKLMLVYTLRNISTLPAALAWLVVVISDAGAVLLYAFVRDVFDDRPMALFAAVLYLFVPGKLFFFPLLNAATPVLVLACACLLARWLRSARVVYACLLGAALYLLVFFEPLPLVMGLLFAALVARALWRGDVLPSRLLLHVGAAAAAFAATYLMVYASVGFDLLTTFRQVGAHAAEFNAASGRPYSVWVRDNIREFVIGAGVCQMMLAAAAFVEGMCRRDAIDPPLARPIVVLSLSLFAILAVIDLIGLNRAEVVRLWIFLACFFQIPAAYACARLRSRTALGLVLAVTLLEGTLGTAMIGFIIPG